MENKAHRKVHKKRGGLIASVIAIVVGVIVVGCVIFVSNYKANTIADNIYVHSLHLGGMDADKATAALENAFGGDYFDKNIKVTYDGRKTDINLIGIVELDAKDTVSDALGRSNNLLGRIFNKEKIVLSFELEVNEEKLEDALSAFATLVEEDYGILAFNKDFTSADVNIAGTEKIMDTEKTAELIRKNVENNIFTPIEAVLIGKNNEDFVDELYDRLDRPAINAYVGMNEDGSTYVVPEQVGIRANEDLFEDLYERHKGVFTMDINSIEPEITASELNIEFYQDVLGEYTSAYNVGLVNRTKNVALAARLVNGTVIMPGHRFSYNGVVGKRTYERGFVDATVYTGEGTEEGLGGGICQVSSTIYCAQLRADLKTISRSNHSYTVVYVPHGQDATVVYGAIDYVFENSTNYPIKILANANGGYLNVKIMGTKVDKSLSVDVVSVTEATYAIGEVQKETTDLPTGTTEVKQNGQIGARVSTYKVYYKNGVEQKREFVARSNYKPMNKIILVGTGEVVVEPENPDITQDPDSTESSDVTEPTDKPLEGEEVTDLPVSGEAEEEQPGEETPEDEPSDDPSAEEAPSEDAPSEPDLSYTGL